MMLPRARAFVVAVILPIIAVETANAQSQRFTLSSPAFEDNAMLPVKYAGDTVCGGDSRGSNISPPLTRTSPPAGTKSFAVLIIDPAGRRGIGSGLWVAYGLPAQLTTINDTEAP